VIFHLNCETLNWIAAEVYIVLSTRYISKISKILTRRNFLYIRINIPSIWRCIRYYGRRSRS